MKFWIDDVRPPPDDSWVWIKTLQEAAYKIGLAFGESVAKFGWPPPCIEKIEEISLDHDLGGDDTTMWVARKIEEFATYGVKPPIWHVHSANPVGRANLEAALQSADRLWEASKLA